MLYIQCDTQPGDHISDATQELVIMVHRLSFPCGVLFNNVLLIAEPGVTASKTLEDHYNKRTSKISIKTKGEVPTEKTDT